MSTAELRQKFLDYFAKHKHTVVASSSLIPANDPTLLFVNAGMVQFKDVFLGLEHRDYNRAATVQRCVRAGGKHNDLENVGFTARHHTFFEMLGNFSFGDYFKREAIKFAWTFLTEELQLPKEKLWVTVYEKDQEAEDIWLKEMGIDATRFSRCGDSSNFWAMGDTGPCGPCTEIFYDHGSDIAGGPPGSPDEDGDRYIEIWNLVFMQFERQTNGELKPLPKPSVDTGMGLERISAVMQHVHSNYEIDLFQHIIQAAARYTDTTDLNHTSLKVIADHIRSCSFLIVDGVRPSNEGRGYVLRRIIRRAARHGHKLGMNEPFFYKLVDVLVQEMGVAYPELALQKNIVEQVLLREEQQFAETLEHGMRLLEQDIAQLKEDMLSGETVFKLYDTYGFPIDLTADIARERNLKIDEAGFEKCMQEQRQRSQASSKFAVDYTKQINLGVATEFLGYQHLIAESKVEALFKGETAVEKLNAGDEGCLVLDKTPFYAESGGQAGDTGVIQTAQGLFVVHDTKKAGDAYLHMGQVQQGVINLHEIVTAEVNAEKRQQTALNHSATHLLHAALRTVLGGHVIQKGSLVEAARLRFDFAHHQPVTAEELALIEEIVNREIRTNHVVETNITSPQEAQKAGAMALFGEKYGDAVRVLSMGEFSKELCGGTHVKQTGDIGVFKIVNETGIAAGVRRIEAVTGEAALKVFKQAEQRLQAIMQMVKAKPEEIADRVKQMQDQVKTLEKQVQQLQLKLAQGGGAQEADAVKNIAGMQVLIKQVDGIDNKTMRDMLDQQKNKLGSGVIVLASVVENKVQLITGVTKDLVDKVHAGELISFIAAQVGGKGGGRPDMAQAGGTEPAKLNQALASVENWLQK